MGAGHVACSSALEILRGNNRKEEMLNWDDSEGRNMTAGTAGRKVGGRGGRALEGMKFVFRIAI